MATEKDGYCSGRKASGISKLQNKTTVIVNIIYIELASIIHYFSLSYPTHLEQYAPQLHGDGRYRFWSDDRKTLLQEGSIENDTTQRNLKPTNSSRFITPSQISTKKKRRPSTKFNQRVEVDQVAKLRIKSFGPRCFRKTWDAIWDALTNGHVGAGIRRFGDSVQDYEESTIETNHLK